MVSALLSVARSTVGYQSRLAQRDAPAVAAMHELAAQYPRYGYRRIQVFVARRGHTMRFSLDEPPRSVDQTLLMQTLSNYPMRI